VQVTLTDPYFHGTLLDQLHSCIAAADIDHEDDGVTLYVWPKGGNRGGPTILVSPQTGLIGYPAYTHSGLALQNRFDPGIVRGGLIKVESSLSPACGVWRVFSLTHVLESETPNGAWFSYLEAAEPAYAPIR
jgi:hypothetical protein